MVSLLLAIIYLAFISLGLPDSLLGSAWPVMMGELDVPFSFAGIITIVISVGTIVSSLMSDRITRKLGAGLVTAVSVLMTAVALFGFSVSNSFYLLCLFAIPYGLGAGAIDAAINNFVALHYSSRQMSWLHCFWGVGAALSPYIMGYCLSGGLGWHRGYFSVSVIQIVLTAVLFISLPLWKQKNKVGADGEINAKPLTLREAVKIKGVKPLLVAFFAYCAVEQTTMLWASSYLVDARGLDTDTAARFASMFLFGLTIGRFLCGFVADFLGDKMLIRMGTVTAIFGAAIVAIPFSSYIPALVGLVIIGVGCAPVYPSVIHSTPSNFGKENSQAIIGIQMAVAYLGTTFTPPIFGVIAQYINISIYPFYLLFFAVICFAMTERLNKITKIGE